MLEVADRPIEGVMEALARRDLEAAFLVPTATGLSKSIMDAHGALRAYLKEAGFHDYGSQPQGSDAKQTRRACFILPNRVVEATASLYRPTSGNGDPRIWFSGLPRHAAPGNVLAIIAFDGTLYVVNASAPGVLESLGNPASPFAQLAENFSRQRNSVARELLALLRDINALGYVRSLRDGPTGVGMTLETLLGIPANSSKAPDYKGIELKASRTNARGAHGSRFTLFSKVPDWGNSTIKSAVELLEKHGYDRDGRRQLYCSMSALPNSLGLSIGTDGQWLHAMHGVPRARTRSKVVQWDMDGLRSALEEKHGETFWVKAVTRKARNGAEEFKYAFATHTKGPIATNFDSLIESGHIELDFLLHLLDRAPGQKPRARDHGYLFKMDPRDLPLLFPPPVTFDLSERE